MMTKKEKETLVREITEIVLQRLQKPEALDLSQRELVGVREAAEILGYTPEHMRRVKDQYPHIKHGNNPQGKLLFFKDQLVKTFAH